MEERTTKELIPFLRERFQTRNSFLPQGYMAPHKHPICHQYICFQTVPYRIWLTEPQNGARDRPGGFLYKPEGSPRMAEKSEMLKHTKGGGLKLPKITETTPVAFRKECPLNSHWLLGGLLSHHNNIASLPLKQICAGGGGEQEWTERLKTALGKVSSSRLCPLMAEEPWGTGPEMTTVKSLTSKQLHLAPGGSSHCATQPSTKSSHRATGACLMATTKLILPSTGCHCTTWPNFSWGEVARGKKRGKGEDKR